MLKNMQTLAKNVTNMKGIMLAGCFICAGPQKVKNCPIRGIGKDLDAQAEQGKDVNKGEDQVRSSPLQFTESSTTESKKRLNLLFIDVLVNGKEVRALVDRWATYNFVAERLT